MKPQRVEAQSVSFWNALDRKSEEIENAFQESSRVLKCYVCTRCAPCIECQHCTMNTCCDCIVSCEGCKQAFCNLCALPKSVSSLLFSIFSIFFGCHVDNTESLSISHLKLRSKHRSQFLYLVFKVQSSLMRFHGPPCIETQRASRRPDQLLSLKETSDPVLATFTQSIHSTSSSNKRSIMTFNPSPFFDIQRSQHDGGRCARSVQECVHSGE